MEAIDLKAVTDRNESVKDELEISLMTSFPHFAGMSMSNSTVLQAITVSWVAVNGFPVLYSSISTDANT